MDDKGFIFTGDATLALVVVIVVTASIVVYAGLPIFQGQSHEHLEALADSVLETMEQNGTLRNDAVLYSSNNSSLHDEARADLIQNLNLMIPNGIGYKLTIGSNVIYSTDLDASKDHTNPSTATDIATKVKVISGPQEGWVGRAYYKQEEVKFVDQNQTQITTVWNFHNWLQNFYPWEYGLDEEPYWAGGQSPTTISFSIPNNGTINGAKFLLGSSGGYDEGYWGWQQWVNSAYGANFILNGNTANHNIAGGDFTDLQYASPSTGEMYNYLGNISGSELLSGLNNFYINFDDVHSSQYMPWFSIIANYTTSIKVPQGVLTNTTSFPDISGVGNPTSSLLYNLNTGQITNTPSRSISWNTIQSNDIDTNTPFVITGIPSGDSRGSAVATTCDVYLPNNTRLFDAYTVVNAFGGCDRAIVQVKNSYGMWQTIFTSWDYTARYDGGYGNIPGILNIAPYLTAGHNTVRIILWDNAPSNDYDLVGLTNCYSTITYSQLPIKWDTFAFNNKQYSSSTGSQTQSFNIANEAQEALLFVGTGTDSRSIKVTCQKGTLTSTLYNGPIPYVLNLGDLDAAASKHIITKVNSNGSYDLVPGSYSLTVSVTPGYSYESGDFGGSSTRIQTYANPEIFSGTRISVIYPKFLQNSWSSGFASTAEEAKENARQNLINTLSSYGISINPDLIKTEAIYAGDTPNSIPVRLDLWQE